ncbi:MAG TPA: hypothetical protein VGM03_01325 [Phycisphaerae bacterium]|jgi:hypothetical protein
MHKSHQSIPPSSAARPRPRRVSIETFERQLPVLVQSHPGEWVAYHRDRRVGIFSSQEDAVRACLAEQVPELEIYVRLIQEEPCPEYNVRLASEDKLG